MFFLLLVSSSLIAQEDTTEVFDYSKFGDAEGVKRYCTQKVLNQSAQRIVSFGYEHHGGFSMPDVRLAYMLPASQNFTVNKVAAIRAQVNIPVISTNKFIWQLGANYWGSRYTIENPGTNLFAKALHEGTMTSAGINSTIFKPLNEKNFLILQGSVDANGIFNNLSGVNGKSITYSATAIYGWKTTTNMFQVGFELEGNQFWMNLPNSMNGSVFIQRGEMKPRIMWDKKISGFIWLNAQAGLRYNYRFDVMNEYDARKESLRYFTSNLGNPFYFNISLNLVSP